MRVTIVVVALAAALAATGCGGQSKQAAISDYITRVNDVERGMAGLLQEVSAANRAFARSQTEPGIQRRLTRAEQTMRKLRHRVALVQPPPEARHLHDLFLQLIDQEVALTREVRQLATFTARYQVALKPLQTASGALKTKLAATAKGAAATKQLDASKADELEAYAQTLQSVELAVRRLDPPHVWRPAFTQQLSSLDQLRTSSLALAGAIRANDAAAIPHLLQRFDAAAVSTQTIPAQKRQIAAVKAYNARIRALVSLAQRAERERVRLQRTYK